MKGWGKNAFWDRLWDDIITLSAVFSVGSSLDHSTKSPSDYDKSPPGDLQVKSSALMYHLQFKTQLKHTQMLYFLTTIRNTAH